MMTRLEKVKDQWLNCKKCGLCEHRSKIVFSDGPETASIMIVGEGPGQVEDATGLPFTGPAGELLNKILASVNIKREDCYITNAVRCRPYANRTPLESELRACRPLLEAEIESIKPKLIIIAGSVAAKTLMGGTIRMADIVGGFTTVKGCRAMAIYHPAAILHMSSKDPKRYEEYRRSVWESMKKIRVYLDESKQLARN